MKVSKTPPFGASDTLPRRPAVLHPFPGPDSPRRYPQGGHRPGHGGQDPGCSYKQFKEKDIVLNVALRLGELIKDNFSDVEVIYTRKTDVFIPLYERGNIANKAGADLFFSIHVNAARSSAAAGTETFVMGVDKAGRNLDIAMKENDVITFEDDYSAKYQGYVPGSSESFIIFFPDAVLPTKGRA